MFLGVYPKPVLDRIQPSVDRAHRPRRGKHRLRRAAARADRPVASRRGEHDARCVAQARRRSPRVRRRRRSTWYGARARAHPRRRRARAPHGRRRSLAASARRSGVLRRRSPSSSPRSPRIVVSCPLWHDVTTHDGPDDRWSPAPSASTASRCSSRSSSASPWSSPRCSPTATCAARTSTGPSSTCSAAVGVGRRDHGVGQRPDRAVPRPRDPVDRAVRAGRRCTCAARESQEAGMKYFVLGGVLVGVLPLRHRPGLRRHRARPTSPTIADVPRRTNVAAPTTALLLAGIGAAARRASGSRSRPCRSTRGRPTCTRARRRRSPAFMAVGGEGRRLRRAAAGLRRRLRRTTRPTGSRSSGRSPCSRCSSARCSPSCRPTSSACWPTRRSATPASSSSGVQAAHATRGVAGVALLPARLHVHGASARFGVVTLVGRTGDGAHDARRLPRPGRAAAVLAFAFTVFLLAQAGVPLTSGFFAKFYVIAAAVDAHSTRWPSSPCSRPSSPRSSTCGSSWPCTWATTTGGRPRTQRRDRSASRSAPGSRSPSPSRSRLVVGFLPGSRHRLRPRRRARPRPALTPPAEVEARWHRGLWPPVNALH